jgi:xanthine dehydrogenase accessory factor
MGQSKALLDAAGTPFLARVVDTLSHGGCGEVVVVVQAPDGPEAQLARTVGARVVTNPDPGEGPITSIRAALASLSVQPEAILVLPVDHPGVRRDTVQALLTASLERPDAHVVVPRHGSRRGHPALFRSSVFAELMDMELAGGARTVVRRDPGRVLEVPVDDPGVVGDIDTPEDYRNAFGTPPDGGGGDGESAAGPVRTETALDARDAAAAVVQAVESGHRVVTAMLLAVEPLRRIMVFHERDDFRILGSLGREETDTRSDALARQVARGEHPGGKVSIGDADLYLELHQPTPELVVVGGGHIARPLTSVGALLGFRVTVADDRPEFVTPERFPDAHRLVVVDFSDPFADIPLGSLTHLVLVTRGHKYDFECLRQVVRAPERPRYVGMIGSRRRVRATFEQLLAEGIPRERLKEVRAPVGMDLGAETPEEIAISVAAQLVQEWRGGSGLPLHSRERVLQRFFPDEAE